jgi:hypothetical protein
LAQTQITKITSIVTPKNKVQIRTGKDILKHPTGKSISANAVAVKTGLKGSSKALNKVSA